MEELKAILITHAKRYPRILFQGYVTIMCLLENGVKTLAVTQPT